MVILVLPDVFATGLVDKQTIRCLLKVKRAEVVVGSVRLFIVIGSKELRSF
jgi:hypothetical protein